VKVVIKSHMVNLWVRWLGIYRPVERLLTALDGIQVYGIGYFQSNTNSPWQVTENSVVKKFSMSSECCRQLDVLLSSDSALQSQPRDWLS